MLCKIADLLVEVPEAGMIPRLRDYLYEGPGEPAIVIDVQQYHPERYAPQMSSDTIAYLASGYQFNRSLIFHNGFFLHSSAIALDGRAYLFSGHSGVGKSTHTGLWQRLFGDRAFIINDDKPALRLIEDSWFVYGTPWSGKHGINQNAKVPLCGICFLKQGKENTIRRLEHKEAISRILEQTIHRYQDPIKLGLLLDHIGKLVQRIPVYELVNKPEEDAARLSYSEMLRGAEEAGL